MVPGTGMFPQQQHTPATSPVPDGRRWATLLAMSAFLLTAGCGKAPPTVLVETEPPGAAIWVDRELRGPAPCTIPLRSQEALQVRASMPGYDDAVARLDPDTIAPDRRLVLQLQRHPFATMLCRSQPAEATVLVDGEYRGTTPLTLRSVRGSEAVLTVRADGFRQIQKTVTFDDTHQEIELVLESLAEGYYRQRIREQPLVLSNHVDLGHQLMLAGRVPEAVAVLRNAVEVTLANNLAGAAQRLWAEIQKILNAQYEYGGKSVIVAARTQLADMLADTLTARPAAPPPLYVMHILALELLNRREEAEQVFAQARRCYPQSKELINLQKQRGYKP